MTERVTITVLGEQLTFEVRAEPEKARQVARQVEEQVEKASTAMGRAAGVSKVAVMCLAAMQLADEYLELKAGHEAFVHDVAHKTRCLMDRIGPDANAPAGPQAARAPDRKP